MLRLAFAVVVGILVLVPGCSGADGEDEAGGGTSAGGAPSGEAGAEESAGGRGPTRARARARLARTGGGAPSPAAGAPSQGGATPGGSPGDAGSPAAAGAEGGAAGSGAGVDLVSCEQELLGAPCADGTTHSDCGCDATYCAVQPGATEGMCTRTGCVEDPSLCPEGYSCLDLSAFQPGSLRSASPTERTSGPWPRRGPAPGARRAATLTAPRSRSGGRSRDRTPPPRRRGWCRGAKSR